LNALNLYNGSGLRAQGEAAHSENLNDLKLLSVIIPAYNTAKFLNKCVASIAEQTYQNIEIVIVNNGSTDSTPEICEELKAKYNNRIFKIINLNPNQGINFARRAGVEHASGDYIAFIDSDDYIEPETYGTAIKILEENSCDMVQFAIYSVDIDGKILKEWRRENLIFNDAREAYKYFLTDINPAWNVWDKVYKRELFKNIEWLKISALEDYCVSAQLFAKAQKFMTINKFLYNYVQHSGSTMHRPSSGPQQSDEALKSAVSLVVNLTQKNFPDLMPEALWHKINLYHIIYMSGKQIITKQDVQNMLRDYNHMRSDLKAQGRELYIDKRMRRKQEIKVWMLAHCPRFYKFYLTTRLKLHALTGI